MMSKITTSLVVLGISGLLVYLIYKTANRQNDTSAASQSDSEDNVPEKETSGTNVINPTGGTNSGTSSNDDFSNLKYASQSSGGSTGGGSLSDTDRFNQRHIDDVFKKLQQMEGIQFDFGDRQSTQLTQTSYV